MKPLHFVCVLRHGGAYNARYVNNLFYAVIKNVRSTYTFTVLTDNVDAGFHPSINVVPLNHSWKSWWAKIEMFAPGLWREGRVWYFDLDTLITNDITDMVNDSSLGEDFYTLVDFGHDRKLASGVMTWIANTSAATEIYQKFAERPEEIISSCCSLGDQCWIGISLATRHFLQEKFPGMFVSFKMHCNSGECARRAKVVCFHGLPRPLDAIKNSATAWVQKYWK